MLMPIIYEHYITEAKKLLVKHGRTLAIIDLAYIMIRDNISPTQDYDQISSLEEWPTTAFNAIALHYINLVDQIEEISELKEEK